MNRQNKLYTVARLINILIIGFVAVMIFVSALRMESENVYVQAARLHEAIRRAAIQCYALEGAFPSDVFHLREYGVIFDESRFIFHYELDGISNYMPEILVIPR